jgi:type II secretory pathway pseudopilin PulG
LLIVVSILIVFSGIAIQVMFFRVEDMRENKAKQDAQTLASLASAAHTAGHSFSVSTVDAVIVELANEVEGKGIFAGMRFKKPVFSEEDTDRAKKYLAFANGELVYDPNLND